VLTRTPKAGTDPEQAKELLPVPDRSTLKGKRDYVILALLVGCALRRNELAELDVETIQQREERWVLADLQGKSRRIRTVAIRSKRPHIIIDTARKSIVEVQDELMRELLKAPHSLK
jgi:site-specific recombinase XerD